MPVIKKNNNKCFPLMDSVCILGTVGNISSQGGLWHVSLFENQLDKLIVYAIILTWIKKKKYPLISINYITFRVGEKNFKSCITVKIKVLFKGSGDDNKNNFQCWLTVYDVPGALLGGSCASSHLILIMAPGGKLLSYSFYR